MKVEEVIEEMREPKGYVGNAIEDFHEMFDAEHVGLMERFIEEAPPWRDEEDFGNCWWCGWYGKHAENCRSAEYHAAEAALNAYRAERGLL